MPPSRAGGGASRTVCRRPSVRGRDLIRRELYRTNYSCITPATLQGLYTDLYRDRLEALYQARQRTAAT